MTSLPAPNQQARQQLAELDALLQRMLALPISGGDESQPTRPMDAHIAVTAPLPPGKPVLMPLPNANPLPNAQPGILQTIPMEPRIPFQPIPLQTPVTETPQNPNPLFPPINVQQLTTNLQTRNSPPVSSWELPWVFLNRLYDAPTYLLGPVGRKLRSPEFSRYLGWCGVCLALGAIGWTVALRQGLEWNIP